MLIFMVDYLRKDNRLKYFENKHHRVWGSLQFIWSSFKFQTLPTIDSTWNFISISYYTFFLIYHIMWTCICRAYYFSPNYHVEKLLRWFFFQKKIYLAYTVDAYDLKSFETCRFTNVLFIISELLILITAFLKTSWSQNHNQQLIRS